MGGLQYEMGSKECKHEARKEPISKQKIGGNMSCFTSGDLGSRLLEGTMPGSAGPSVLEPLATASVPKFEWFGVPPEPSRNSIF